MHSSFPVVNEKGYLTGAPSFLEYNTLGVLTRKDILDAYERTVIKIDRRRVERNPMKYQAYRQILFTQILILPVCANCKKIREENSWKQMEADIAEHSLAKFSHTICPDCCQALYPDLYSE